MPYLLLFVAALVAFALSTVSGGGAGLLLLPVLAYLLPGIAVPAALTIGTAVSTVSKLTLFWKHVSWPIARRFIPAAIPGVLLGGFLLKYLNPLYFEVVVGLFLISNLTMLRPGAGAHEKNETTPSRVPTRSVVVVGFLAGFLSGLTGAVGLLFNKIYFKYGLTRDEVVATRAANEALLHVVKLCLYGALGLLTAPVCWAGATVAVGAIVATAGARSLLRFLPEIAFRRIGYAAMVASGIAMLTSAATELRTTENLRASATFIGSEMEITGWWRSRSVTVELELSGGPSIEQPVALNDVPTDAQASIAREAAGLPIVKIEEVWRFKSHSYEVYVNENGRVRSIDVR